MKGLPVGSEGLLLCASPGAAGGGQCLGALAEVCGAFVARGGTDALFTAVRAGGLMDAAIKQKVAAFGLTAVDHTVHRPLSIG